MLKNRFPIYIPSKGRWDSRLTMRLLEYMGVDYRVIVEEQEYTQYCSVIDKSKILVLDKAYQRDYDTFDNLGDTKSKGPGPARNFAWDHSIAEGAAWHWVMDDNIRDFYRVHENVRLHCFDPIILYLMESFVLRYKNIGMAGPQYRMFIIATDKRYPFTLNTRIYSCNLIRNDVPYRWRGRYNEDSDLSIRMLKDGWCTVLFNAFLQGKIATQRMKGGNTKEFYAQEGTQAKSEMLKSMHPDVVRLVWRFGRPHHYIDLRPFRNNKLALRDGVTVPKEADNYGLVLTQHNKEDKI